MIWLQTPTVFWLGGGTISLSCWIYMGLMILGRQKYIQHSHCLCRIPWFWDGFCKTKKTQITKYWWNLSITD